ncbi:hypothetical protein AALP_AA6G175000 [Arabis alpina]|nr:hypothetical protein AALP_AA6G175000 [Arabis alpina]
MDFSKALPSNYLGLFNSSNNGKSLNQILAVEFDTVQAVEMNDIDDNHVGIDLNGVVSIESAPAAYFDNREAKNISLRLASGDPIRAWIEYNATEMMLNVTLAPLERSKPNLPLLSRKLNLSGILSEEHFVGFSASTGTVTSSHFVLGWSFNIEGKALDFDITKLPSLPDPPSPPSPSLSPPVSEKTNTNNTKLIIIVAVAASATVAIMILILLGFWFFSGRQVFFTGGARKFSYQTISSATGGFNSSKLMGERNSGSFYKGQLAPTEIIAVKRITCTTRQQKTTLIAEIDVISKIRQKNLVNVLGYCSKRNEVYIVYEYIPNGSLDRFLFNNDRPVLTWSDRFCIIKGIASAIQYLHNDGQKPLVHGNVKASNVLLDEDLNSRLGDYGQGSSTGHVAPELVETGKVTCDTDVYAFGVLMMEIVCGRKAIEPTKPPREISLVNWVLQGFKEGDLLQRCDSRMTRGELVAREVLLVLKTGLLCANRSHEARPMMKKVLQFLDGAEPLPHDDYLFYGV